MENMVVVLLPLSERCTASYRGCRLGLTVFCSTQESPRVNPFGFGVPQLHAFSETTLSFHNVVYLKYTTYIV